MTNVMIHGHTPRLAIYYEHPEWFNPLFAELERRSVAYDRLLAHQHVFDPAMRTTPYALIVNRMSPSAFKRGHSQAIFGTLPYLAYLQEIGANVLNGYNAYVYEFSKARQLSLFERLGLRYPRARVINDLSQASAAAEGLTFPVVIKPNIGGSGAGIFRFDSLDDLHAASSDDGVDLGIDHTALVQEYLPAEGNSIVRVEVLGGEFLYAIRIMLPENDFNLCPADYCRVPSQQPQVNNLADGGSGSGLPVESYMPPAQVIADVQRILTAANIEVGGVEYLVNERDGQVYYYDINALSNFVANAPQVVGFDPFPRLVDYLLERAEMSKPASSMR
jgi:glutathione synthase/RimK-type ligase-like ATP-grasp enzyme